MDVIQSEIVRLAQERGLACQPQSKNWAEGLAGDLRHVFGAKAAAGSALWESFDADGCIGDEGLQVVSAELGRRSGVLHLLIDDWSGYSATTIVGGESLAALIREHYNLRWYITNAERSFVLCRNDHDVVIYVEIFRLQVSCDPANESTPGKV